MRLREHEGIKEGKLDMLRADPRHLIVQEGYNVRDLTTPDAIEKLKELAASIAAIGVTDPLVVRFDGEKIIIVEGHRRLAATLMAIEAGTDIKSVPIYQQAARVNDAERDLGLLISNSGEPLTQMEKAIVVGRLDAHGWPHPEIARKCGWKSTNTVTDYLKKLGMSADLQKAVKDGKVSATVALKTEKENPGLALKIIEAAEKEQKALGKKGRATPKAIAKASGKPDKKLPIPPRAPRGSETLQQEPASSVAPEAVPSEAASEEPESAVSIALRFSPGDLVDALAPFAGLANEHDLTALEDSDILEVFVRDVKRAATVYARATGSEG